MSKEDIVVLTPKEDLEISKFTRNEEGCTNFFSFVYLHNYKTFQSTFISYLIFKREESLDSIIFILRTIHFSATKRCSWNIILFSSMTLFC